MAFPGHNSCAFPNNDKFPEPCISSLMSSPMKGQQGVLSCIMFPLYPNRFCHASDMEPRHTAWNCRAWKLSVLHKHMGFLKVKAARAYLCLELLSLFYEAVLQLSHLSTLPHIMSPHEFSQTQGHVVQSRQIYQDLISVKECYTICSQTSTSWLYQSKLRDSPEIELSSFSCLFWAVNSQYEL